MVIIDFGTSQVYPAGSVTEDPATIDPRRGRHDAQWLGDLLHDLAHNEQRNECGVWEGKCLDPTEFLEGDDSALQPENGARSGTDFDLHDPTFWQILEFTQAHRKTTPNPSELAHFALDWAWEGRDRHLSKAVVDSVVRSVREHTLKPIATEKVMQKKVKEAFGL